ncbi:UNVERIFIED_CONTAM: Mitogen-activated protein kinase kinase [Sesamum radiatum]|uniref:mitogen-activated protein kinase kinase n=1 Tax=Sesamum radiatum TaxID=300843 RepID=A0AAW2V637_SESRA
MVRDRRHLNLRLPLPEASERRPRFPLPLPSSTTTTNTSTAATTAIAAADLEKLQVLGHGNGGTVYKVRHEHTSSIYALKVIHGDSDPAVRRQVLREVSILRLTDSPHVIKCHGVFDIPGGDISICMEYMDMGTLETLLRDGVVFTERLLAKICRQPGAVRPGYIRGELRRLRRRYLELRIGCVRTVLGHFPYLPPGERPDWATLMCAICFGEPPTLPESASENFSSFIECCLQKDSSKRWSATQLLSHPFISNVEDLKSV